MGRLKRLANWLIDELLCWPIDWMHDRYCPCRARFNDKEESE